MLLTRSRLCPRPKPGSSLHLHVLGTPPAFVLSQDQTLREVRAAQSAPRRRGTSLMRSPWARQQRRPPHPHKESSGSTPAPRAATDTSAATRARQIPGLSLVGSDPCAQHHRHLLAVPPARGPVRGSPMYTGGSGARRGQSWHRRVSDPRGDRSMRRRRTWTHLSTGIRSRSVHAVEFSKTVAPLQEGVPPQGAPGSVFGPGRTDDYSAPEGHRRGRRSFPSGPFSTAAVKIAPER